MKVETEGVLGFLFNFFSAWGGKSASAEAEGFFLRVGSGAVFGVLGVGGCFQRGIWDFPRLGELCRHHS